MEFFELGVLEFGLNEVFEMWVGFQIDLESAFGLVIIGNVFEIEFEKRNKTKQNIAVFSIGVIALIVVNFILQSHKKRVVQFVDSLEITENCLDGTAFED